MILRHDVDLSLDGALAVAEVEADEGAWSTWFLMTRSVFYNLASSEGEHAIARLRELGHRVAHHAVYPRVDLDERFDAVVAWHNPDPEYMHAPIDGAVNVMEAPFFDRTTTAPTRTSTGATAARTSSSPVASSSGCSCSRTRRSGRSPAQRCGSRWSRCSTPTARLASSICARTASTCRERGDPARRRRRQRRRQDRRHGSSATGAEGGTRPPRMVRTCRLRRRPALPRNRRARPRDPLVRRRPAGIRPRSLQRPDRGGDWRPCCAEHTTRSRGSWRPSRTGTTTSQAPAAAT